MITSTQVNSTYGDYIERYGAKMGAWMPDERLRALCDAGVTYEDIAAVNQHITGWLPAKATVKRKLDRMGIAPRHASHKDLIPWKIRPEHNNMRMRKMLQAESRARQGLDLSEADKVNVQILRDLVYSQYPQVVGYRTDIGFYLTPKLPTDEDIIRHPNGDGPD